MAHLIHAKREGETVVYRVWSTVSDGYLTDPMDEAELRFWLRMDAIESALRTFDQEVDRRIERAQTEGTSSRIHAPRPMDAWQKERT